MADCHDNMNPPAGENPDLFMLFSQSSICYLTSRLPDHCFPFIWRIYTKPLTCFKGSRTSPMTLSVWYKKGYQTYMARVNSMEPIKGRAKQMEMQMGLHLYTVAPFKSFWPLKSSLQHLSLSLLHTHSFKAGSVSETLAYNTLIAGLGNKWPIFWTEDDLLYPAVVLLQKWGITFY